MRTFWRRTIPSRPTEASTRSPTFSPTASRTFFGMVTWNSGRPSLQPLPWVRKSYLRSVGRLGRSVNAPLLRCAEGSRECTERGPLPSRSTLPPTPCHRGLNRPEFREAADVELDGVMGRRTRFASGNRRDGDGVGRHRLRRPRTAVRGGGEASGGRCAPGCHDLPQSRRSPSAPPLPRRGRGATGGRSSCGTSVRRVPSGNRARVMIEPLITRALASRMGTR